MTGDRVVNRDQTGGARDACALALGGLSLVDVGDQFSPTTEPPASKTGTIVSTARPTPGVS
ncbi:hypothetical protein QFZ82_007507 [Streptomyces sp. V4I23]|nr:hypothetical protein [Streptomyces sp. V4I23]